MRILEFAKVYAKETAVTVMGKTVNAIGKLGSADRSTLNKAMQTGALLGLGLFLASKLLGMHVLLGIMGGTIALGDVLEKIEDEEQKELIAQALATAKAKGLSAEALADEIRRVTKS
jgi:hypothetical protein